jgi:hypothetical protein
VPLVELVELPGLPPGLAKPSPEWCRPLLGPAGLPLGLVVRAPEVTGITLKGTGLPLEATEPLSDSFDFHWSEWAYCRDVRPGLIHLPVTLHRRWLACLAFAESELWPSGKAAHYLFPSR